MALKASKYDFYWRLRDRSPATKDTLRKILQREGYDLKKSQTWSELFTLTQRVDLGYLCYDACLLDELKKFAVDRSLMEAKKAPTKRWLVNTLMHADEHRTFFAFLELPAELRKRVYELYVSAFQDQELYMPTQPPLARTCSLLRREALPVFYSGCKFQINYKDRVDDPDIIPRYRLTDETIIFISSLAPGSIGDLQKLSMEFLCSFPGFLDYRTVHIDLSLASCNSVVVEHSPNDVKDKTKGPSLRKREVAKVVDDVLQRPGASKLQLKDLHAVGKAVEIASKSSTRPYEIRSTADCTKPR